MSRWLQNVGTFLEKLDDQAEQIAQKQEDEEEDDDGFLTSQKGTIESILAARGLDASGAYNEISADVPLTNGGVPSSIVAEGDKTLSIDGFDDGFDVDDDVDPFGSFDDGIDDADLDETENPDTEEQVTETVLDTKQEPDTASGEVSPILPVVPQDKPTELPTFSSEKAAETQSAKETSSKAAEKQSTKVAKSVEEPSTSPKTSDTSSPETATIETPQTEVEKSNDAENAETNEAENGPVTKLDTNEEPVEEGSLETNQPTSEPPAATAVPDHSDKEAAVTIPATKDPSVRVTKSTAKSAEPVKPKQPPQQVMTAEARQALKEVRVLRRHVVSLNKQLETAEGELSAQRDELERAATRMETDRTKAKEEKANLLKSHALEISNLQTHQSQALKDQKERSDQQMSTLRLQIKDLESRRRQEGGDWNKELEDAVKREKEAVAKFQAIDDEKATLLAQLSTLQNQQQALGSRLESLTQSAEAATERERQAEDRLDEALSLHARQVAQRQAREVELEKTVADLGAALVEERNKASLQPVSAGIEGETNQASVDLEELAGLREQLEHEQQRSESLQAELNDVSRERSDENAISNKRQQRSDEQLAQLSQTVSKLKGELKASQERLKNASNPNRNTSENGTMELRALSEEILQHRENQTQAKNEIAALRNRLQAAVLRADKAEAAAEEAVAVAAVTNSSFSDVEHGSRDFVRKRRVGGGRKGEGRTMRAALHIGLSGDESTQRIGKALDGLDVFLKESGKFLRYNPVARLFFILYLVLIHLWTFALVFMHADSSFDMVHNDVSHGPQTMLRASAQGSANLTGIGDSP